MTKSLPWQGIVGGAGAGDDSGRYNAGEWWSVWGIQQNASGLVVPDAVTPLRTLTELGNVGVYYDVEDRLIVTGVVGTLVANVKTGAALVEGTLFYEDVERELTLPLNQTSYVVVRKNYTGGDYIPDGWVGGDGVVPAYTARITWVKLAQVAQSTERTTFWDIPLATVVVGPAGITSITDTRKWVNTSMGIGIAAANNAAIHDVLTLGVRVDDGAGDDELGMAIRAKLENDSGDLEDAGQAAFRWTDATNGSEDARFELRLSAGNADNLSAVINAPTTASADGDARGAGAVDLQQNRQVITEVASGDYAFLAAGVENTASGDYAAVVAGAENVASGIGAFASGFLNTASGDYSEAGGSETTASGNYSHAEGRLTQATGSQAHAEGAVSIASGEVSHAEGLSTTASGDYSHAEGVSTVADGDYSHAGGRLASTNTFAGVFIWADSENAAFTADRANQFKVRASGVAHFVQNNAAAALPVLELEQNDEDQQFIEFDGTSGAGTANSISTMNGGAGAVDGPLSGAGGWTFNCMIRVSINGVDVWIPGYRPV